MHHVWPIAATALALMLGLAPGMAWAQATPQAVFGSGAAAPALPNVVERGVPAEAVAENAVVARERALAAGQREAYRRIAARAGLPANASDAEIDALVEAITIEEERSTRTGYSARITVVFSGAAIAARSRGEAPPPPGGRRRRPGGGDHRRRGRVLDIHRLAGAAPPPRLPSAGGAGASPGDRDGWRAAAAVAAFRAGGGRRGARRHRSRAAAGGGPPGHRLARRAWPRLLATARWNARQGRSRCPT